MRLEIDGEKLRERLFSKASEAQHALDAAILCDMEPYVPMDTGALAQSGHVAEAGRICYNAPHARKIYYGSNMQINTAKHPHATAQWFEVAKAIHNEKWRSGVASLMGGK